MFDRMHASSGGGFDTARTVGMGSDFQAERIGRIDNCLHLCIGEMRFETATLLTQDPAGRGNLDQVRSIFGGLANFFCTFHGAGTGEVRSERVIHFLAKPVGITMPSDNRNGPGRSDNARSGDQAICGGSAQ